MALTVNTRTYSQDRVQADSVDYAGVSNTLTVKDVVQLKRTFPKPSGASKGVARPSAKITRTEVINATTGETGDIIIQITGSIPVGVTSAMVNARLADVAAWINTADAQALFNSLDINV